MLRHLIKFLLVPLIAVGLLSSCTLTQIHQWEASTGIDLSPETEQWAINHSQVIDYVNGLPYAYQEWEPARLAWRAVMKEKYGWDDARLDRNEPFVKDVIMKESGGCWNIVGGQIPYPGTCFDFQSNGNGEDAGFGQVTSSGWGKGGVACKVEGLCSRARVIESPWNSMVAMSVLLVMSGKFPWCWNTWAQGFHACHLYKG